MDSTFVINIGRQLGSGGRTIGAALASRLGISYYDKELINLASQESGLCAEFFEKADERTEHPIAGGLMTQRFSLGMLGLGMPMNYLSNDALFQIQSDVIRKLADEKSCVFVGRCADYVLRDHPRAVSIFLAAPKALRVEKVASEQGISAEKAAEFIDKVEKKRADFYNYYSNKVWGSAASYDLCIDTSVLGPERTTDYIEQFVRERLNLPHWK